MTGKGPQCALPECTNTITAHTAPNPNPKKYCSDTCRKRNQRRRRPHTTRQPTRQPGNTGRTCKADGCGHEIHDPRLPLTPKQKPKQYCSQTCREYSKRRRRPNPTQSGYRKGGNGPWYLNEKLAMVWDQCETNPAGCLIPKQRTVTYNVDAHTKRTESAHRAAFRLYGDPTGRPVHHVCAGGKQQCCNPQHLQLVTTQANMAEMLTRTAYQTRIRTLENRLIELGQQVERFHFFNT